MLGGPAGEGDAVKLQGVLVVEVLGGDGAEVALLEQGSKGDEYHHNG